ncbi:MAG: FAD-binding oxidoreductase, partial [Euryarchaeota archaeon]|nr:FAD-binding oxidoreductase [Euryarchaeota archaeon]
MAAFRTLLGESGIGGSHDDRLSHAFGKSYRDLMRLRLRQVPAAPDLVVYPGDEEQVRAAVDLCAGRGYA